MERGKATQICRKSFEGAVSFFFHRASNALLIYIRVNVSVLLHGDHDWLARLLLMALVVCSATVQDRYVPINVLNAMLSLNDKEPKVIYIHLQRPDNRRVWRATFSRKFPVYLSV